MTFEENYATATCKFLEWQPSNDDRHQSNCSIVYGYNSRFPIGSESALGLSSSDTVVLNLSISEVQFKQEYQFIVTASNGSFTSQVTGTFSKYTLNVGIPYISEQINNIHAVCVVRTIVHILRPMSFRLAAYC